MCVCAFMLYRFVECEVTMFTTSSYSAALFSQTWLNPDTRLARKKTFASCDYFLILITFSVMLVLAVTFGRHYIDRVIEITDLRSFN